MQKEIIILEDDKDIREICTYFLKGEGFEVNSYANIEGFATMSTIPSLFLLDIRLPDGSGLDVCLNLKNDKRYDGIPIIMMSAHMNTTIMMERCKADHFIAKPFGLDHLLQSVKSLIK